MKVIPTSLRRRTCPIFYLVAVSCFYYEKVGQIGERFFLTDFLTFWPSSKWPKLKTLKPSPKFSVSIKKTEYSIEYTFFKMYSKHCTLYRSHIFEPCKRIFTDKYKIKMLYSRLHIFLMVGTCFSCQNTPILINIMTVMIEIWEKKFVQSRALKNGRGQMGLSPQKCYMSIWLIFFLNALHTRSKH